MIKKTRVKIQINQTYIRTFENAVYWVAQDIDDYDKLKRSIQQRLLGYVKDQQFKQQEINEEIKKEDEAQLKFLKSVGENLNARIEREAKMHMDDHKTNMKANSELIEQVIDLRDGVKRLRTEFAKLGGPKALAIVKQRDQERDMQLAQAVANKPKFNIDEESAEVQREVLKKREYIQELEHKLGNLQAKKAALVGYDPQASSGRQWQM